MSIITVAHRGAPTVARENTLRSIRAAIDRGADWVEIDTHVTADGRLVVVHDPTFERLWGVKLAVAEGNWPQLEKALDGGTDDGVPLLGEVLEVVRDAGRTLMIDLPDSRIARVCCDFLQQDQSAVVLTGDPDGLTLARDRLPRIPIALSWESPDLPGADLLAACRPQWVNQQHDLLDDAAVDQLHSGGHGVCCYTVDDPDDMHRLASLGVDAIISNDISLLRKTLVP
ncbi:glycerophosphodiester phosphodiesterase [Flexivirga meconopsidis]|uniref:glycerophosphodiester phosphodiesterase n=1 Tax=Flexivirga meconopsidis TaxID=2977121 RepID=UPI00223F8830|nr:glycerophosphodiester phosphodiesterase [Flexivirga meconopsidis]